MSDNSDYSSSPQMRNGRFHNTRSMVAGGMPESKLKAFYHVLFQKNSDTVPAVTLPVQRLSRAELDAAPNRSLYRLGHSTVLMKFANQWWLTDPVFAQRASPLSFLGPKRFHETPLLIDELPPIRAVILSHDHYDHLDRRAIRALNQKTTLFLCPLGVGEYLSRWGVAPNKIQQFDWWQDTVVDGLKLTLTPTQHFSGRGFNDSNRTLWGSWVIQDNNNEDDFRLFFSGDSGYFDGFAEIGKRFGPFNLTLIENGAYSEQWPYVHMHPKETVQAHLDLQGQWLLPIHNGTFDLATHSWHDPFEQVLHFAKLHGVSLSTPIMGERVDMNAPHEGERWWRLI